MYDSTMERLSEPRLLVRAIKMEFRRQLGGLLPFVHQIPLAKKLLRLMVDDSFSLFKENSSFKSCKVAPLDVTKSEGSHQQVLISIFYFYFLLFIFILSQRKI